MRQIADEHGPRKKKHMVKMFEQQLPPAFLSLHKDVDVRKQLPSTYPGRTMVRRPPLYVYAPRR